MGQSLCRYLRGVAFCLLATALSSAAGDTGTIEFTTTEVTEADVTISPDGQWLIFTMLGHLFRLDRKSTRLNSSHIQKSRMPSSA